MSIYGQRPAQHRSGHSSRSAQPRWPAARRRSACRAMASFPRPPAMPHRPVARRGHPRRLQPRLCPEPRADAPPRAARHAAGAGAANDVRAISAQAGPLSIAMTVRERHDLAQGYALERMGIGPEDVRKSQLVAGSAVARIDDKTAVAFGFAEGAKAMERRLERRRRRRLPDRQGHRRRPGLQRARATAASRSATNSAHRRHRVGRNRQRLAARCRPTPTGSPYRWTSIAADRAFGGNWLSLGISRLEEKQSLLGGRMSDVLGGGGSTSTVPRCRGASRFRRRLERGADRAARLDQFRGRQLPDRRLWRSTSARSACSATATDRLAPVAAAAGRAWRLRHAAADGLRLCDRPRRPTAAARCRCSPNGREIDSELSYGSSLLGGNAWLGGNLFYRRQPGTSPTRRRTTRARRSASRSASSRLAPLRVAIVAERKRDFATADLAINRHVGDRRRKLVQLLRRRRPCRDRCRRRRQGDWKCAGNSPHLC